MELTILMPCLNEAETIEVCVRKARAYLERTGISGEVLISDNGSTDGSQAMAEALGARVVHAPQKGYGAALIARSARGGSSVRWFRSTTRTVHSLSITRSFRARKPLPKAWMSPASSPMG